MGGLAYGAEMVWQFYDPDLFTSKGGGPPLAWQKAIELPGSCQMEYVQKAITVRGYETYFKRIPSQGSIIGDAGEPVPP